MEAASVGVVTELMRVGLSVVGVWVVASVIAVVTIESVVPTATTGARGSGEEEPSVLGVGDCS